MRRLKPDQWLVLFTAAQVAQQVQLGKDVIYRAHATGKLKAVRVGRGRNLRFTKEAVHEWLGLAPTPVPVDGKSMAANDR